MLKETITGISQELDSEFDGAYEINTEKSKQGLINHTFQINVVNFGINRLACSRFQINQSFDILFFLSETDSSDISADMKERLYQCMELIEADNAKLRGSNMSTMQVDGVIHFLVNYDVLVRGKPDVVEDMEYLNILARAKE